MLADHRKLRRVPHLIMSERVQRQYPPFVCDVVEQMFTVDNPDAEARARARWANDARRRHGVRVRDLLRDGCVGAAELRMSTDTNFAPTPVPLPPACRRPA